MQLPSPDEQKVAQEIIDRVIRDTPNLEQLEVIIDGKIKN
jgi:hypothetical protein